MSPEEVARALYRALADWDRDALSALLDPAFVGETTAGLPLGLGGRYEGPGAMRRDFWGRIGEVFDVQAEPQGFVSLPDGTVLVNGRYRGSVRATARRFEAAFVHTLSVADGRVTRLVQLTDSRAWSNALDGVDERRCTVQAERLAPLSPSVSLTVEHGVAHLRLQRPDEGNALDARMARDLLTAAATIEQDPSIRAVLITAAGTRFCVGGDVALFAGTPPAQLPPLLDGMIDQFHRALLTLAGLPVPVVCAVRGAVAGGGLGLLWCSDIVLAADDTRFAVAYGRIGLTCDGGSTWYLPRLVGPAVAAQMFLLNRALTAEEAHARGLVAELAAFDDVDDRAHAIARQLASGPTRSVGAVRQLLRSTWQVDLAERLDEEHSSLVQMSATHDAQEGIQAFLTRRTPAFEGR